MTVRIKDLPGADSIATDDKLVLDGATNGARSFPGSSATANTLLGLDDSGLLALKTDLLTVVKTAAAWTASSLVLAVGQAGYASDTASLRVGNGVDLFDDLDSIEGGSDHDAVTLSSSLSATISSSRDLISSDATFGLSAQEIWHDRFRFVDSSGGALNLPLADSLTVGAQIDLRVTDATSAITIKRPTVAVEGTGTTNGTNTVAMADTSPARVGDVAASDVGITSGQTVLSITPNTSVTLSAAADGSVTDETITFTGQRGVFNGTEADVTLRKGLVVIKVTGNTTGIDADIVGATNEGLGPVTIVSESADFTLAGTHLGKRVRCTKDTGTQTITIPKPSAINADPGVPTIIKAALEGATTFTLAATGGAGFVDIAANTLNLPPGGAAVLTPIDDDNWDLEGSMVPS